MIEPKRGLFRLPRLGLAADLAAAVEDRAHVVASRPMTGPRPPRSSSSVLVARPSIIGVRRIWRDLTSQFRAEEKAIHERDLKERDAPASSR